MGLDKINKIKKQKGMTNLQLSELSGVPLGTLDKITSGRTTDPKLETIKAIAKALGCSLDDFDDDNDLGETSQSAKVLAELYDIAKGLSEDEQLCLLDIVKALKHRLCNKKE